MKRSGLFILIMWITFLFGGCAAKEEDQAQIVELNEATLNEAQTTVVTRGDIEQKLSVEAQVGPRVVQLKFPKEGYFGGYVAGIGEAVKEGDILARAENSVKDELMENKEKELAALDRTYEYSKKTYENNVKIAEINLEAINDRLENTEYPSKEYTALCVQAGNVDAGMEKTKLLLRQLQEKYDIERPHLVQEIAALKEEASGNIITAPFDGVVVARYDCQYGDEINKDYYYVAIADENVWYARSESQGTSIIKNSERITLWLGGREYDVEYVPRDEEYYLTMRNSSETNYAEFEILLPDEAVAFGDYGFIKYLMSKKEDVLLIPENALYLSGGTYFVYRDNAGNHEKTVVKIGLKDGLNVEITEGLQEGDVVYVKE